MAKVENECWAIIPARSGSKGLPGKNVKNLCGKPLLAWSIEAAIESDRFDTVIVSTDSAEYGEIAKGYGAQVAYRGRELSDSCASTFSVLADLLGRYDSLPEYFALLQPTSPLRDSDHIADALNLITNNKSRYDYVVSVSEAEHSSDLVRPLADDGSLALFDLDYSNYRRQDRVEYSPNGAIFIAKPEPYLQQGHFFGSRSLAYVMSKESSVDIDDEVDFMLAEICMERRLRGGIRGR